MQSSHSAVQTTINTSPEERKIEVLLDTQDGADQVVLRYSTWTEGLGWCGQKTIRLDSEHLDELQRALMVARHRIKRRRADAGETKEPARVIQLPSLS